tara:strand:- start:103 stop:501 length:399 start_codon:yes stop_codon:yes gene_type:complete
MLAHEFDGIFKRMHDLVGSTGYTRGLGFPRLLDAQYLQTIKTEDSIVLWKELPGVKAKDIEIEVDAKTNSLHLKVDSKHKYFDTNVETYQSIPMDADLDAEVKTVLEDGVLTLTFPIKASAKPRKIEVKAIN